MTASIRLESQLTAALRSLEPEALPARMRVRIASDLRVPVRGGGRWRTAARALSAAASIALLLLWAGLLVAVASSVANAGPAANPAPSPGIIPTVNPELPPLPEWPVLWDVPTLAIIVAIAALTAIAATLPWVRTRAARVVCPADTALAAVRPWPRRPARVSKLPLLLAALPVSYLVTQPYVGHPLMGTYSAWIFLSASFGWAAALRYSTRERSARWLIAGGTILALGRPMFLDTYATLDAVGWGCIAVGLAMRAGIVPRPRRVAIAAVVALALWIEIDSATNAMRGYGGPAGGYDPWPQLLEIAALRACALVALTTAAWAAWKGWRSSRARTWLAAFVGIAGLLALEIYDAQAYWVLLKLSDVGLLPLLPFDHSQQLYDLQQVVVSLLSLAVLLGLLGGLEVVARTPAPEGAATTRD